MAATTFVLTVSQSHPGSRVSFNVISPDGGYRSGERQSTEECQQELEQVIARWNRDHPEQCFGPLVGEPAVPTDPFGRPL